MAGTRTLVFLFLLNVMLLSIYACSSSADSHNTVELKQIPEISEIKPQKPVKIKLKRNDSGRYSWELNGDDAEKVIEVDTRLRDALKAGTKESK